MSSKLDTSVRTAQAGVLAWVLPGLGHYWLGHRGLASVFFVAITFPYWTGIAFGGVLTSVNPKTNPWLFVAEAGIGSYTGVCLGLSASIGPVANEDLPRFASFYPASEVAQIYLAVAGLLNLLAIFDAIMRAQTNGLPVFHHEVAQRQAAREGPA